jgi:hypothetical protein
MPIGTGQVYNTDAPKARINMTLNEDLVRTVREHTNNLSDYVEKNPKLMPTPHLLLLTREKRPD